MATLAQGNSRVMLALCAAFAPVLFAPCGGLESGGFNFTGASSTGKTTALLAASSVWGKGSREDGYAESWRATDNGLESRVILDNDALKRRAARQRQANLAFTLLCMAAGELQNTRDAESSQQWEAAEFPGAVRLAHKFINEARARLSGEVTP